MKKCVFEFSDQFQHKLGCTITEYGQKLEIDSRIEGLLKCVFEFSDQFQHKLGCTITEYGQKLGKDSRIEGLLKLCTDKQTNTVIRYAFTLHLIFFISVLRPFQYYFTYIKMSQSVGCAKLGELWEKNT